MGEKAWRLWLTDQDFQDPWSFDVIYLLQEQQQMTHIPARPGGYSHILIYTDNNDVWWRNPTGLLISAETLDLINVMILSN